MKLLVTGGTGVIGESTIAQLLASGHSVRLLSRHATRDVKQWNGVEPFNGDVADAASIAGAAAGCDCVLHIAGIATEHPPERTFEAVNVGGTRNILAEAVDAGASRFVFVSSLGADTGESDYHKSKFAAERLVETSELQWTIVRPGGVFGPGDEVISTILKMVRALPAVPVIDSGDQEFQPIWHEDLAKCLAAVVERDDLARQIVEAAGPEITTMNDLLHRFATITGRSPVKVPIPMSLAQLTARLASMAVEIPIDETKLTMLREKNVARGRTAAEVLGISMTPLDTALRLLADELPESLPEDGVGQMEHKRFWAEINGSRHTPATLMTMLRDRVTEIMPIEFAAEPDVPRRIDEGSTLTAALPLRGNIQVRVELAEPTHIVFATIEGHPLAGIVEFKTEAASSGVRFSIDTYTRAANTLDWIAMKALGGRKQTANWEAVIERIIAASGGSSDGVHEENEVLDDSAASAVSHRVASLIQERKRDQSRKAERAGS